ncbi:Uncharacterised protein [Cedecea neteri]|uniref:Uncharacterized protein n=1 Tax=Cedecea neteri TaxID=158822 RepID=A0A2X2SXH0_9ENTR|nr:hypothetical protein [Cedecea neteri]SQA96694.1 Uncharacterised protein [Cedecea neteri]
MAVKLEVTVAVSESGDVDFRFEFEGKDMRDKLERNIAESMASACLNDLKRLGKTNEEE